MLRYELESCKKVSDSRCKAMRLFKGHVCILVYSYLLSTYTFVNHRKLSFKEQTVLSSPETF